MGCLRQQDSNHNCCRHMFCHLSYQGSSVGGPNLTFKEFKDRQNKSKHLNLIGPLAHLSSSLDPRPPKMEKMEVFFAWGRGQLSSLSLSPLLTDVSCSKSSEGGEGQGHTETN